ncbi:uncharacterized protein LOC127281936 isoform X2 [Leptopilina boulardi]|nr:uncharacterized protein LOC127281936 isoform X2 [Leptopilina boulardi]XP_051161889.1 uncharacterized protein LOC127281936 isoform X2 [Leptopilina boulardi]
MWKEYFDTNLNSRQVKDSQWQEKSKGNEPDNLQKNNLTLIASAAIKNQVFQKITKMKEENPEYMEVEESNIGGILAEKPIYSRIGPKKSFPSFFPLPPTPTTTFVTNSTTSIVLTPSKLARSSRSSITPVSNLSEDETTSLNVSRSFGQFTFKQNEINDVKENLNITKPIPAIRNSVSKEIIDVKQELEKGKRKLRPLMQEKKQKPIYSCSCWQIIFFLLLPVLVILISAIFNQPETSTMFFNPTFNFTNVTENLPKFVHGQNKAIMDIVEFFKLDNSNFKIITFIGGTGVGKTHVANIIKDSLPNNYYKFEYFPTIYNKIGEAYSKLSICRCNIIVLENLGNDDISDAAYFAYSLKKRASNLCVLILALFNTQVTDNYLRRSLDLEGSAKNIENTFKKENVEIKSIIFEPLGEESIVKCIKDAINESHLKVTNEDFNQLKEHLLISNSGCKGAYSKVQLFGKVID